MATHRLLTMTIWAVSGAIMETDIEYKARPTGCQYPNCRKEVKNEYI